MGDAALEDQSHHRDAQRGPDLVEDEHRTGGAGDRLARHRLVDRAHGGRAHQAHAESGGELGGGQRDLRGAGVGAGEDQGAETDEQRAGGHQPASADLVREVAGDRHADQGAQAQRGEQQAGFQDAVAVHLLVVQRQQEQEREETAAEQEHGGHAGAEALVPEQPQIEQGCGGGAQGVHGVRGEQDHTDGQPDDHLGAAEAVAAGLGQRVDERGEAGGEQRDTQGVEGHRVTTGRRVGGQHPDRQHDRGEREGDVDQEHPLPGEVVQQQPADDGPDHRAERDRYGDQAHDPADPGGPGGARDHGHHDRVDHAAAEALDDAEGDQALRVPGEGAERRADQEDRKAQQPHAFGAEPDHGPAGQRNRQGDREQIAGGHPFDGGERRVELAAQRADPDVDDRRVQVGHHPAEHHDADECEQSGIEPGRPASRRLCFRHGNSF